MTRSLTLKSRFLLLLACMGMALSAFAFESEPYIGQINAFPLGFQMSGWMYCDGRDVPINQFRELYALLGTRFGGDGRTYFRLPDMRNAEKDVGGKYVRYFIAARGYFPDRSPGNMGEAIHFIGEVQLFAYDFVPSGFRECNGQTLSIADNRALFALLGTKFGGNGQNNFALPQLSPKNMPAGVKYYIAVAGKTPDRAAMQDEPFISAITLVAFDFVPAGYSACAGNELTVQQNAALYSLIGINFGGTQNKSFRLPTLAALKSAGTDKPVQYVISLLGIYPIRE